MRYNTIDDADAYLRSIGFTEREATKYLFSLPLILNDRGWREGE